MKITLVISTLALLLIGAGLELGRERSVTKKLQRVTYSAVMIATNAQEVARVSQEVARSAIDQSLEYKSLWEQCSMGGIKSDRIISRINKSFTHGVHVFTNVSFDGGLTWRSWVVATNQ